MHFGGRRLLAVMETPDYAWGSGQPPTRPQSNSRMSASSVPTMKSTNSVRIDSHRPVKSMCFLLCFPDFSSPYKRIPCVSTLLYTLPAKPLRQFHGFPIPGKLFPVAVPKRCRQKNLSVVNSAGFHGLTHCIGNSRAAQFPMGGDCP